MRNPKMTRECSSVAPGGTGAVHIHTRMGRAQRRLGKDGTVSAETESILKQEEEGRDQAAP